MAERKPVVLVGGVLKEMPPGDALPAANIPNVTAPNIHAAPSKTTPADADELGLSDSAASWELKKLTFANLKAVLLAYFKGQFREKLTAARTYYIRTDGSDSNTGLSNTAGGAFATIQKAWDVLATLDGGGFSATVRVADGSYTIGLNTQKVLVGFGSVAIVGNTATPSSCQITVPAGCIGIGSGIYVSISGFRLASSGGALVIAQTGSICALSDMEFAAAPSSYQCFANGGRIELTGAIRVTGGAVGFAGSQNGGAFGATAAITLVGTPTFNAFVTARDASLAVFFGTTFTGSATGARYLAETNGVINTFGSGETFLPGSSAGIKTTGGQYL